MAAEALAEAARRQTIQIQTKAGWRAWLGDRFPGYVSSGFAPRHVDLWDWAWAIRPHVRPAPYVAIWPRGGAKSTSAELAVTSVGIRGLRRYALYVGETQDQADKHVATIGSQLESAGVERAVNKYGSPRGWRRNRLRAAGGFTVDALGLDTAARGIKVDDARPDFIVLDDIDARHDSPPATAKKIDSITQTILPAGSVDCAVLAVQNLIHANSIFSKLATGEADFLHDRIISGPFPALESFDYELRDGQYYITAGVPTWAGQGLEACQDMINTSGLRSFLREAQQQVGDAEGALWTREMLDATRVAIMPEMVRIVVAIDPEASSGEDSAETGIMAGGKGVNGHGYLFDDASLRASPSVWATAAVAAYSKWKADRMVAEANNGGEMVANTIETIPGAPPVKLIHASRGKQARAEPIAALYEQNRIHHVGYFPDLENQLCTWVPGTGQPSPDRLDADVWLMTELDISQAPLPSGVSAAANPSTPSRFIRKPTPAGGRFGRSNGGRGWHK